MNYLCFCYYDVDAFTAMSPDDLQDMVDICKPHDEALRNSGRLRFIGSLGMPDETHTLRGVDGKTVPDDRPFTETRVSIGAFFMIEAGSMDEARKVAGLHPSAHLSHLIGGGIEIRPVGLFDQF